jgi:hypothetical protein
MTAGTLFCSQYVEQRLAHRSCLTYEICSMNGWMNGFIESGFQQLILRQSEKVYVQRDPELCGAVGQPRE